jgi:hypothetical protein
MRKTLTFILPDERMDAYAAEFGHVWLAALRDLDEWLRREAKNGAAWADQVRRRLHELIEPLDLHTAP